MLTGSLFDDRQTIQRLLAQRALYSIHGQLDARLIPRFNRLTVTASWPTHAGLVLNTHIVRMDSQEPPLLAVELRTPRLQVVPSGPGRILNEAYLTCGRHLGKKFGILAHQIGLGPDAVAKRIEGHWQP